jgi:selenocysteine-specific elongation factor
MIVATSGHVDHGKTALVKALTGVDADRLPEEKKRGMTIDLGFAYKGAIGFVDVPGHERFVHSMLAGICGIDLALLVVAADDGPMPQTHEHLAIVRLLGVPRIAVALTKVDRVSAERRAAAIEEVRALLPDAPIFPVCAPTGEGIAALESFLAGVPAQTRSTSGNFRLSVDRAFTLPGAGLIVTGSALCGEIAIGAEVRALLAGTRARVRAIHAHNAPVQRGSAGQRLALNLAGLHGKAPVARGEWIVAGAVPDAVRRFDARLDCAGPIRNGSAVHLHIGCADVTARVFILDDCVCQVVADKPLGAVFGDRFLLRDASARRTLGGGTVLDVFPPARGRSRPERLAMLAAMAIEDDAAALAALAECSPWGLDLARFAANRNLPPAKGWRFTPAHWSALREKALATLEAWHGSHPEDCLPQDRLLQTARVADPVAARLVEELVREGLVAREPTGLRLSSRRVEPGSLESEAWRRVRPLLERQALRPPTVAEMAAATGIGRARLVHALDRLARRGLVVRISDNRYFLPAPVKSLERMVLDMRTVTAAAFRDRTGLGRGLAIELLEYFDRRRLTRRVGDAHVVTKAQGVHLR